MATPIVFNNTTYPAGFVGTDDGIAAATVNIDNASTYSVTIKGTVTNPGDTVTLTFGSDAPAAFAGTTATLTASQFDNNGMIEFTSPTMPPGATDASTTGFRYILSNSVVHGKYLSDGVTRDPNRTKFMSDANDTTLQDYQVSAAPCFVTGTLIRVLRDDVARDVAVEDLAVGDLAMTASGMTRPIIWIGHRTIDCRRHPRPQDVKPVRIRADTFGDNRPARDLVVSPGHAICVDAMGEILVPAIALVDGEAVTQIEAVHVTYWHVELDAHDILLADNMPAESYLEMGNRSFFAEAETVSLHARPDMPVATHADFCRPFVASGPLVDAVKGQMAARSAMRVSAGERAVA